MFHGQANDYRQSVGILYICSVSPFGPYGHPPFLIVEKLKSMKMTLSSKTYFAVYYSSLRSDKHNQLLIGHPYNNCIYAMKT